MKKKCHVGDLYQDVEDGGMYLVVQYIPHPYNNGSLDLQRVDKRESFNHNVSVDHLKTQYKKIG